MEFKGSDNMKDTKEVVLFYKDNVTFNIYEVAKEIEKRYEELGEANIIAQNDEPNNVLFVFNQNPELQMQTNKNFFSIVMNHNYFEKIAVIVFDIIDAFLEFNVEFGRIGYISSCFLSPKYIEVAKERYLKKENLEDIHDINLSWYRKIEMKYGILNSWERIITDEANFKDLLCQYDFNSPRESIVSLDMKYIKEFFKVANDFISSRTEF